MKSTENTEDSTPAAKKTESVEVAPMVSIDIQQMLTDIKQKEEEKVEALNSLNIGKVQQVWEDYRHITDSPSVKAALGNCQMSLEDVFLTIVVPNINSQNIIKSETSLFERLREETGAPLKVKYTIDVSKFPEMQEKKPKEFMTDKERFKLLYAEKSNFRSLVDKFNLRLYNE